MMTDTTSPQQRLAESHFEEARREARRERLRAWFTGDDAKLLPFEPLMDELFMQDAKLVGLREIPLDKIAGSVGRFGDFTRSFLPLHDELRDRWVKLESLVLEQDWPPIDVYRVGDAYFVIDGNHRVAIARKLNRGTIAAHVWTLGEELPLAPDQPLDEVLLQLGAFNFMRLTHLDEHFPDQKIVFSAPGRYRVLLGQIWAMMRPLTIIQGNEPSFEEAAVAWYENVFQPAVTIIEESDLLERFPERTAADLFVWLVRNEDALRERYGTQEDFSALVTQVAGDVEMRTLERVARRVLRLLGRSLPAPLPDLPQP